MNRLEKAIELAVKAHQNQTDKGGQPYIFHPLRVMTRLDTEAEQIVGVLHDVVEDSSISIENLKELGFGQEITTALRLLTRKKDADYQNYIRAIANNPLALSVKLEDLKDNMRIERIPNPQAEDYARLEKYRKAFHYLINSKSKTVNLRGYKLIEINESHYESLYKWYCEEESFEYFTCRPIVKRWTERNQYINFIEKEYSENKQRTFVLLKRDYSQEPIAKINLFDYNPRNRTAEIGYYMPLENRGKGYGTILLGLGLEAIFNLPNFPLNKVYATTSSENEPSISLLEKMGFLLEGRLREHYWIDGKRLEQLIYAKFAD